MSDKLDGKPIGYSHATALVVAELRRIGIRKGEALPSEAALQIRLGIGRQQLREALIVLETLGAVESRRGARRVWRGSSPQRLVRNSLITLDSPEQTVGELLEVRHALETSMLPSAAHFLSPDDFAELRELAIVMEEKAAQGMTFFDEDEAFHKRLLAPAENRVLDSVLSTFWALFRALRDTDEAVVEDPTIASMHSRILDALEDGDSRLATYHLDTHFYGVRNRYPDVRLAEPKNLILS